MRALVVDDEILVLEFVCAVLARDGYETLPARWGWEALELARQYPCDWVITDFKMPGMNGCELIALLKDLNYPARYLLISGTGPEESMGVPFLRKPFTPAQLRAAIKKINQETAASAELDPLEARAKWLKAMKEMNQIISNVPSDIPLPDGSLLIRKSGLKRAAAFKKYLETLRPRRAPGSDDPVDSGPKKK